jgi:7,8-dihydro-6-hydroxymethylpterin-pyrophosphokinase
LGDARIDEPGLKLPHPRARERAFVLDPLREVWPEAIARL